METYLLAIMTGLFGGAHCIGMCGPVVASYSLHASASPAESSRLTKALPHILYNTGRISTYTFIGALMGTTGSFVNVAGKMSGVQDIVPVIAGGVMVLMGTGITGLTKWTRYIEERNRSFLGTGQALLHERSLWRYFLLGALLGLLPCGLSYSVFIAAAATGGFLEGMLYSFLFGCATVPWLFFFGTAVSFLGSRVRGIVYRSSGIIVIISGIYFIWKGVKGNV